METEGVAQQLRMFPVLPQDLSAIPSIHLGWLPTAPEVQHLLLRPVGIQSHT